MNEQYVKNLEEIVKQMLKPLKNLPFNLVIEAICGYKIIPFNNRDDKDMAVLSNLIEAANIAGENISNDGIKHTRPNEVGNRIEPYVKKALGAVGYEANTPMTLEGKRKSAGYPDIEFIDEFGRLNYLECKTFNIRNIGTSQRAFYLSPSTEFKITTDAHHYCVSYEIYVDGREGNNNIYKPASWKLLALEKLLVDVKYEFNADNIRLYSEDLVIAEGTL